ncbi:unnamed protein product [Protopolystoma xenopodis]|uniref:RING-type E3 ubiquitin transferase n=1 Tax=Protopolystoma xenopodis TaxID=117903 RepID=A0A3S5AHX8_9PLAT|nr:unnamed protein product [Protopolystoma xenopodis]
MNINPDDPFDAAVRHRSFTGDRDLSTLSEIPSILTPHTKENMSIPPPPYSSVSVSQSSHTSSSLSVTTSADATISQPPLLPLGMAPSPIGETVSSNLISCIGSKNSPGASNSTGDVTKSNSINNELTPNEDESGSGSAGTAPSSSANGADDGAGRSGNNQGNNATNTTGSFECNICLDPAKDAVVSLCGHLFCWPCLHQWLETTTQARAICPVCKAAISRNKFKDLTLNRKDLNIHLVERFILS